MTRLYLRFGVYLDRAFPFIGPHGPVFHRWLPDGEQDAIHLPSSLPGTRVAAWFVRRGYVRDGREIVYDPGDPNRRELDSNLMDQQSVLDAGPLTIEIIMDDLADDLIEPLRQHAYDDHGRQITHEPSYLPLGHRADEALLDAVVPFLSLLRLRYGQYWITQLEKWDSRKESLGQRMLGLRARWRFEESGTWNSFRPDKAGVRLDIEIGSAGPALQYLTQDDWRRLTVEVQERYEPPLAAELLREAQRLLDDGSPGFAVVQAMTALESAVDLHLDSALKQTRGIEQASQRLRGDDLPFPLRLCAAAVNLPGVKPADLDAALDLVRLRHRIVHDGYSPLDGEVKELPRLFRVVSALLGDPSMRFVSRYPPRAWMPPERWEEEYASVDE